MPSRSGEWFMIFKLTEDHLDPSNWISGGAKQRKGAIRIDDGPIARFIVF
jgi:hypothetical protein